LSRLKLAAADADCGRMQITVACHQCEQPKRPLTPCPSCHASPLAEPELQAWRLSLHARGLARIKATPHAVDLPPLADHDPAPLRAVIVLDIEPDPVVEATPAEIIPIVPFEPSLPADEALSFNWDDDEQPRRLRKSA
jgi:hypothetical protein